MARRARSTRRYHSQKGPQTALQLRIGEIAPARVRYGYREIRVRLNREGWKVGKYLVCQLYKEEGLTLCQRLRRRRQVPVRQRKRGKPTASKEVWSLDFVADQLADGRQLRTLTVVDLFTRDSVASEVGESLKGEDVVKALNRIKAQRGVPKMLFCDDVSEFSNQPMDLWAYQTGVQIDFSRPGKPTDNAHVESLNGTFQQGCLNTQWFVTLAEVKKRIEAWRKEYTESRPHRARGKKTPNEFPNEVAARRDFIGMQTPEDFP